ncbi:hypothetical protein [Nocardioides sp. Iso805N]|uniref:hypothetical protein n=1 Tax=Nocardioides sp. Iso805N TaxID=1283287 RepID=UPI0012FBD2CB|nr:hypothetical protein [Nocardioides sp. Iso805N]
MKNLLGEVDELARTLAALLAFFLLQKLQSSHVPSWIEFPVTAVVSVAVSAALSRWLWRRPSLKITWKARDVPHIGPSVRIATGATRDERLWSIEVVRSPPSLLGIVAMKRLAVSQCALRVSVKPSNVFYITPEYSTGVANATADPGGVTVPLEGLDAAGPTVTAEMDWQPRGNPPRIMCALAYELVTSQTSPRWARSLVRLDRNVDAIELIRGT